MKRFTAVLLFLVPAIAQAQHITIDTTSRWIADSVRITIDRPHKKQSKAGIVILYALPNGNTTEQTFGKKITTGEDVRYNIQNIGAQTEFIRCTKKRSTDTTVLVPIMSFFIKCGQNDPVQINASSHYCHSNT